MRNISFAYDFLSDVSIWQQSLSREYAHSAQQEVISRNAAYSTFKTAMCFIGPRAFFNALNAVGSTQTRRQVFSFLVSPFSSYSQIGMWFFGLAYENEVKTLEKLMREWLAENA